ncbi:mediator complex subunit 13 C-terminal-domain-containing protein [Podospora australis]|uniref:Mediator of RNA polymerase II transcription subunit 13 n=1 Tax=Podospora australis TaxID=1536484 RepID=A0AAN6WZ17_9PEZI|nr:mediator complex subunit 13 C-terminal-domain-containing protein [Podospora australis]
MDAGEYDTNTLLINNLSSVSFRVYESIPSHIPYTFNASDVEDSLRDDGHLVYMDAVRQGIWCFYLAIGEPPSSANPESIGLGTRMSVCGYPLISVWEGTIRPNDLLNHRFPPSNPINTPSSSSSAGSGLDSTPRSSQPPNNIPTPLTNNGITNMEIKTAPIPIGEIRGYHLVPVGDIHRFFITAVLSSLTTYFSRQVGAIVLNQRTALLPPGALTLDDTHSTSALVNFRVYLTTTGSLVISVCVSVLTGLVSCTQSLHGGLIPGGPVVLAAPFGAFGALQGVIDTDNQGPETGFVQSPETQISNLRAGQNGFSQWKALVSRVLKTHGMSSSLLNGCTWLNIHFSQKKPYEQRTDGKNTPSAIPGANAPWPSVLCFRKAKPAAIMDDSFERAFSGSTTEQEDVLGLVKGWCQEFPKREEALLQRKVEKEKETDLLREKMDVDEKQPQLNGYSPLDARRPSNGGAMAAAGMMYPTPPDGVQPSGVLPLFDTATSSPANQPPMSAMVDLDVSIQQDSSMVDNFDDGWDNVEVKQEQAAAFPEENIFGDLGEDMFEGNELTDADFSFFDQDPDGLNLERPMLPDSVSGMGYHPADNNGAREVARAGTGQINHPPDNRHPQPQFTKPELKHARSVLAEESRQQSNLQSYNNNSAIGIKRHPSPFNPETVFKKIRASLHPQPRFQLALKGVPPRRRSLFERVDFNPALSLDSKKYQESGPFKCDRLVLNSYLPDGGPLTTGRLQGSDKRGRSVKELPSDISRLLGLPRKLNGTGASPPKRDDGHSDSEDSSWASDEDNSSDASGHATSPAKSGVLRRRMEDDVISMAASFKDLDNMSTESPSYSPALLSRLHSEVSDLSLARWFADPEPIPFHIPVSDEEFITVAQVLTEQAASGFLRLSRERHISEIRDVRRCLVDTVRYVVQGLQRALPRALAAAAECPFRSFVEVPDLPLFYIAPQPLGRLNIKPGDKGNFFPIPPPHVELRRNGGQLAVLPSAVSFWESLGLGPAQGSKDILSVCVFPNGDGMRENASVFLERIQSSYETLKLGSFGTLPSAGHITGGLVPFAINQDFVSPGPNTQRPFSAFTDQMVNLARALASSTVSQKNFVVFFVYEPENPTSIVDSCAAFQELFEHYKHFLLEKKKSALNELVLQLIPFDLVASDASLVILSSSDCNRLCFETYDRCTLFSGPMPAPAIMLEKALPKSLQFEVESTPSPDPLQENSYIHIAYAQSVDERWISAAWTDNRGDKQMTASYCLGRRNKPATRYIGEIIPEIWENTYNLISPCKVHWRLIVTKCGILTQQEIDCWISLKNAETRFKVNLGLVTVDTSPSLQLIPPAVKMPVSASTAFYTTPVSTPQPPSVVSPDPSGNNPPTPHGGATTPGAGDGPSSLPAPLPPPATGTAPGEPGVEETLVDITENVWGVIAAHRLNNSPSLMVLRPALASGYLVKRCGPRAEDPPAIMEINIIWLDNNLMIRWDSLLRDIMAIFRGLGTLARVRGVTDKETDVRPWHVAAVEKAVKALYLLM